MMFVPPDDLEVHKPFTDDAVYPWNLESIYPAIKISDAPLQKELPVSLPGHGYPNIEPCKIFYFKVVLCVPLIQHRPSCVSLQLRLDISCRARGTGYQGCKHSRSEQDSGTTIASAETAPAGT